MAAEQKMLPSEGVFVRRKQKQRFKMQAANVVGVNLQSGHNASPTCRETDSVGDQIV